MRFSWPLLTATGYMPSLVYEQAYYPQINARQRAAAGNPPTAEPGMVQLAWRTT